jgi:hypothetical protein
VKLITSHENFLPRDAFRRIIRAGTSISTGQPLAVIGWDAALCPGGRADALRVLRAGHLADRRQPRRSGNPVRLRTVPGNLDTRNITLVADAITAANG